MQISSSSFLRANAVRPLDGACDSVVNFCALNTNGFGKSCRFKSSTCKSSGLLVEPLREYHSASRHVTSRHDVMYFLTSRHDATSLTSFVTSRCVHVLTSLLCFRTSLRTALTWRTSLRSTRRSSPPASTCATCGAACGTSARTSGPPSK